MRLISASEESAFTVRASESGIRKMMYDAREAAGVRNSVWIAAASAWILLIFEPRGLRIFAHCPITGAGLPSASLRMLVVMNPPWALVGGWAVMLVAMMSPVLISPLCHIWRRSFASRRARLMAIFLAGYAAIWMAVGGLLIAVEFGVKSVASSSYLPPAVVLLNAIVWQVSPIKQRCLNRCHSFGQLPAFGVTADFAALRFGVTQGTWCAGSCWALMLFPMLLPWGHVLGMMAASVLILSERLEAPRTPSWRWRGFGKAMRILTAQARIRLQVRSATSPLYGAK